MSDETVQQQLNLALLVDPEMPHGETIPVIPIEMTAFYAKRFTAFHAQYELTKAEINKQKSDELKPANKRDAQMEAFKVDRRELPTNLAPEINSIFRTVQDAIDETGDQAVLCDYLADLGKYFQGLRDSILARALIESGDVADTTPVEMQELKQQLKDLRAGLHKLKDTIESGYNAVKVTAPLDTTAKYFDDKGKYVDASKIPSGKLPGTTGTSTKTTTYHVMVSVDGEESVNLASLQKGYAWELWAADINGAPDWDGPPVLPETIFAMVEELDDWKEGNDPRYGSWQLDFFGHTIKCDRIVQEVS